MCEAICPFKHRSWNISQTGNIIGVDTLKLRTDFGDAQLNLDNNVNQFDTGSNYGSTFFTNTKSFVLTGANMNMNNLLWKGDLSLTAQSGQITQTAAINASELKITGNADLNNGNNTVDVFSAFGSGKTVSFTDKNGFNLGRSDVGNGTLNLGTISGNMNQDDYFPLLSTLLRNRNITNNGGITAGNVNLTLGAGSNAYLTDTGNAIDNFSLLGNSSCVKLVNGTQLNLTGANDSTGILDIRILNGQSLIQSAAINVKGLKVTMQDGGDFVLTDVNNNVEFLSGNTVGINTQSTQGVFVDGNGGFALSASNMNQGDLSLTALNGGNMSQAGVTCIAGGCSLTPGGITADQLKVNVVNGDVHFTTQTNQINAFSGNATGNTIGSQVQLANNQDLNLASSNMGLGDLGLILQNGASLNQGDLLTSRNLLLTGGILGIS